METLSITLLPLIAFNNRATEAFKMYLRDHTPVNDDTRRILTVIFSFLAGVVSVGAMVFSGVSFNGTVLDAFAANPFALAFVGGSMVSFGGAFAQPILEIIAALSKVKAKPETVADQKKDNSES